MAIIMLLFFQCEEMNTYLDKLIQQKTLELQILKSGQFFITYLYNLMTINNYFSYYFKNKNISIGIIITIKFCQILPTNNKNPNKFLQIIELLS